jgi:hypothetical protein
MTHEEIGIEAYEFCLNSVESYQRVRTFAVLGWRMMLYKQDSTADDFGQLVWTIR